MIKARHPLVRELGLSENEVEKLAQELLTEYPLEEDRLTPVWGEDTLKEGTLLEGQVLDLRDGRVLVAFGHKLEGILPLKEDENFDNSDLDIGDKVKAIIFDINDEGQIILTRQNVEETEKRNKVLAGLSLKQRVTGLVTKVIRNGLVISLDGVEAFLPRNCLGSPLTDSLEGQTLDAIVTSYRGPDGITLSRLPIVEEEKQISKEKFVATLQLNDVVEGIVKNVTDFGAFIDIGGLIGLCHISDISLDRIEHPKDILKPGQRVRTKVLKLDKEKKRVSLGIKQLFQPDWSQVCQKYVVNDKVTGKVVSILKYGAFVEIESGVQGLVHISEMSWSDHIRHPSDVVKVGDIVDVVILEVDSEKERLALGIKQAKPDPWSLVSEKYLPGSVVNGRISNKTNFGIFLELEKGIEGLAPLKEINLDVDSLKIGDEVQATIMRIEPSLKRISLSII